MTTGKKITLFVFILVLGAVILGPVYFAYKISADQPLLSRQDIRMDPEAAINAKKLLLQLRQGVTSNNELVEFHANERELNQLIAMAARGSKRIRGRVNVSQLGVNSAFSLHVPENPMGGYLNISFLILPSQNGLLLDYVKIGDLTLSGDTAKLLLGSSLDMLLETGMGEEIINSIQSVVVSGNRVQISYRPIRNLKERLAVFRGKLRTVRSELKLGGDPERVKHYFSLLCQYDQAKVRASNRYSMSEYIPVMFSNAQQQGTTKLELQNEYKAAILALAIYVGFDRFEQVIGKIRQADQAHCKPPGQVTLARRKDLMLHFIVSAGLKVLADNGIPLAIGEFKELIDSGRRGGSGFSFVDLAADKAGLRFTEFVVRNASTSSLSPLLNADLAEEIFFPDVKGLPEGLSKQEFQQYYSDVEGVLYRSMLDTIDRRINKVPLYNQRIASQ